MKRALLILLLLLAVPASASETDGTVLSSDTYAWGDLIGWINFAPTDGTDYVGLRITDTQVTGFAWSREHGWINFNPSSSGQGVTNTSEGELGGSAWVSDLGWISMDGVTINQNGEFVGIAGVAGTDTARIKFDCSSCSVVTDWRPSSVRDGTPPGNDRPRSGDRVVTEEDNTGDGSPVQPPANGIAGLLQGILPGIFGGGQNLAGVPDAGLPAYLFDITLRLEDSVIPQGQPLVAYTSYVSFGTLPTPVDALYTVLDADGNVATSSRSSFIVETERAQTDTFDTSGLSPGQYTLHLRVVYGNGTVEEFDQSFTVAAADTLACWFPWPLPWLLNHIPGAYLIIVWFGCVVPWILLLILLAILIWSVWRLAHRDDQPHSRTLIP